MASQLAKELEHHGIALLPNLLTREQLSGMQKAFAARLKHLRWNDFDGYERTESYRHMIHDVLTLDQGFVDTALHPLVKEAVGEYVGPGFELVEAKGWKSLATRRDFHGWHGDAWYDQGRVQGIPREVKLGLYLTEVKSGAFNYIKGSHGKQAPRSVRRQEVEDVPGDRIMEVLGRAGFAFLFDTSGIHRQSFPILEPRQAVFYCYHDPSVPLQQEDVDYYRYHPLLLNAALLGNLSEEDRRILGFGNKTNYLPGFERKPKHAGFQTLIRSSFGAKIRLDEFQQRVSARIKRMLKLNSKG